MTKILIKNVRVFDSREVLGPSKVHITRSAGNIEDSPDNVSTSGTPDVVVDGQGCTLIPGLIDSYVNIKSAKAALGSFASNGVTTVVDLSSSTQQCQAIRVYAAGRTKLPTVFSSGTGASPVRDHQPQIDDNPAVTVISTYEDAVAFAASRASGPDRADFIKVVVDLDSSNDALLKTIVDAAHSHNKLAIARTTGKASYVRALRAGFDIFAHAPLDEPLDQELAREMAVQGKVFVPTLSMLRKSVTDDRAASLPSERIRPGFPVSGLSNLSGPPNAENDDGDTARVGASSQQHHTNPLAASGNNYDNAVASVRTLYEAGVTICAGTTANLVPATQISFGESLHEELRLLVDAGMSRLDVLRSATCVAAEAFRLSDRGVVCSGLRADLVLIEGDPLQDISATRRIKRIWIQGEDVEPARAV